ALEDFALPLEDVNEACDVVADRGAGRDDGRAFPLAFRKAADPPTTENLIELLRAEFQKLLRVRDGRHAWCERRRERVGRRAIGSHEASSRSSPMCLRLG